MTDAQAEGPERLEAAVPGQSGAALAEAPVAGSGAPASPAPSGPKERGPLTRTKRVVIKTGSSLVLGDDLRIDRVFVEGFVRDVKTLIGAGIEAVLVCSGAVALGRPALRDVPDGWAKRHAAAALGQPRLTAVLANAFRARDVTIAQALITLSDTESRDGWLNARSAIDLLLKEGAVPIINENDTVVSEDVRYGDNDRLAARVAQMVGADTLVLLTDVDGLYTANPATDPSAEHIPLVSELTEAHDSMADGADVQGPGTGGMATKVAAARLAWQSGCRTVIASGKSDPPLAKIWEGARCTVFQPPEANPDARTVWLTGQLNPEGVLRVDAGAVKALRAGASLLPVGVTHVDGEFAKGAAILVEGPNGEAIAKGIAAYGASEILRIKGLQTGSVEAVLGPGGRPAVIHRDDLVLDPELDVDAPG